MTVRPLLTVGHGTADRHRLTELFSAAGIQLVVDVRRFPGSRNNPDVNRDALAWWLPEEGIDYRWEERLGGRRHHRGSSPEPDTWWSVAAFRAYAEHTRTPEFIAALDLLLREAATRTTTVMCSESVWWRCHRRLIADVAVLGRNIPVCHLMPDGKMRPHRPAEGAHIRTDGLLVWNRT